MTTEDASARESLSRELTGLAGDLTRRHVLPVAGEVDREGRIPEDVVRALSASGLLNLVADAEPDLDDRIAGLSARVVREIARGSASVAVVLGARYAAQLALRAGAGPAEARTAFVDPSSGVLIRPDEPGRWWTITGSVGAVVDGISADQLVVCGRQPGGPPAVIMVEAGAGVVMTQALRRSGLHGAGLAHIQFGPGPVAGRRLGGVGLVESADRLWLLCVAAAAIGTAEAALTAAVEYTGQRTQFGQRLSQFAALRSIMGQVRADLDASWAAVEGAAAVAGNAVAARAALTAGAAGVRAALQAIQLHGGYGYIEEFAVERYLRDAVSLRALAGGPRRLTQRSADELFRDRPGPLANGALL